MRLLVLAALAGCHPHETDYLDKRLRREFADAYGSEPRPNGRIATFDLVAAPTALKLIDGHVVNVWAYNGQVPGPTLRVRLGDTLRVRFTNRLPLANNRPAEDR